MSSWCWRAACRSGVALCAVAVVVLLGSAGSTCAQEAAVNSAEGAEAKEELVRPTLDLEPITIREFRPLKDQTIELDFSVILAFSHDLSDADVDNLAHWKIRFRDQVIVAVRTADLQDFSEPEVRRLRRLILLRINRLLKAPLLEGALLTDFRFSQK